jgi:bifunctional non-homologous end joining protein LigD
MTTTKTLPSPRKKNQRGNGQASELEVHGKRISVSNLNKVLFPKVGFTKGQVIDYYIRVAPVLLPHLKNRPVTLKRYPDGVEGPFFYEKKCPDYRPEWVGVAPIWSDQKKAEIRYCTINDLETLIWTVNLADLEMHTFLARANKVQSPTMVVFDLDPGAPADIIDCLHVAFLLKESLDQLKLKSFAKTSGSKGLQLYIPLNTATSYEITKPFAKAMAELIESEHPDLVVSKMSKNRRKGKIFIDWSQNDDHKTTVCVYSLRAKERPLVSTPITWKEAETALKKKDPKLVTFDSEMVLERVRKHGDLFAPVLELKQKIPGARFRATQK